MPRWTRYGIEWLLDLQAQLGAGTRFYVSAANGSELPVMEQPRFDWCVPFTTEELVLGVAKGCGVEPAPLRRMVQARKPMRKVLLLMLLRSAYGLDYCVLTGSDLVLFEPVPEIRQLSGKKMPFLLPEAANAAGEDRSDEPCVAGWLERWGLRSGERRGKSGETAARVLGDVPLSPLPSPFSGLGPGYNSDFIGFDLTVFDRLAGDAILDLCSLPLRWCDQAVLVQLNCCSYKEVARFGPSDRLASLNYDDFTYPRRSRIYHATGTPHKSVCFFARGAARFGGWPFWWALIKLIHFAPECKGRLARLAERSGYPVNWERQWQ